MASELRPYQKGPIDICTDFFSKKNPKPSVAVLPTAWGKSWLIAWVVKNVLEKLPEAKFLVLCPSKELLEQDVDKLTLLGETPSIYSASMNTKEIGVITYATIGSIKNIGNKFKGYYLMLDECHAFPRATDSMLGKFLKESEITHILGLTATPLKLQAYGSGFGDNYSILKILTCRSKKGNLFKEIIHVSQIQEMVDLGFWSPLIYEEWDFDGDALVFNSTKAEFTDESIAKAYEENNIDTLIVERVEKLDRKSILIFAPTVAAAHALAKKIPDSEVVWGDMDKKKRKQVIDDFKALKIRVVINVNVLSIGFDHPQLDCIIGGRATASLSWFYQAMARGTRIHPDKKDCLLIDFAGNMKKFGKLDKLYYKQENIWKLYGENGVLLTGIPIDEIGTVTEESTKEDLENPMLDFGKFKGTRIKDLPVHYNNWLLNNKDFVWNKWNKHIKEALLKINK